MESDPTLAEGHKAIFFLDLLHLIQSSLSQIYSLDFEVCHTFDSQKFNILGLIEELEEAVELIVNEVVIYKGSHLQLIFWLKLSLRLFHEHVMLAQNHIYIDFP